MRVTQSMLSNNMIRNLSESYKKMGQYQDQLATGKKINRPSDDPVVAVKGMSFRTDMEKITQFERNISEAQSWLDNSDVTLDEVGQALQRTRELVVQASSDTTTPSDREKIKSEIDQLKKHIQNLANTKIGDKFIFSGTDTLTPLFKNDGTLDLTVNDSDVDIEVFEGIKLNVNTGGKSLFGGIDTVFNNLANELQNPIKTGRDFDQYITELDQQFDNLIRNRADIGARQNRVDLMENRISAQELSVTKGLSKNEDIDYERTIINLTTEESVHRAALSVGSRIIQPSLVDFLR